MTSPSGRYQSKLFNLFSRSLSQLTKLQPHLRQMKVRAVWGAQVLFHLAYGLIQNGLRQKQESRQLAADVDANGEGAIATSQSDFAISADRSIQRTLEVVEICLSPHKTDAIATSNHTTPAIQGVATQLITRTLVLVTPENEVLDLLTPQQQKQLHQRIIWEIIRYGRDTRLAQAARLLRQIQVFQALTSFGPKVLSFCRQRVGQVRLSPGFSLAAHRFLGISPARRPDSEELGKPIQQKPWAGIVFRTGNSFKVGQGLGWNNLSWVQGRLKPESRATPDIPDQGAATTDELTIRALIRAALAYFFGRTRRLGSQSASGQLDSSDPTFRLSADSQQQLQDPSNPETPRLKKPRSQPRTEPWLTWTDLFGGDSTLELAGSGEGTSIGRIKPIKDLSQTQALSKSTSPVVNQNWIDIEIEAILIGYAKHPLEQLLDWLDRSIAWLERILARLQTYLRSFVVTLVHLIQKRELP